jgi:uncharacterized protein YwlG (UPF0340 family)
LRVLQKSSLTVARIKVVYKEVAEVAEELVGAIGSSEIKTIRVALADCHRVNRAFDLLGLTYLDWP